MVVGAFTILNTIGILGGLPLTVNTANNEVAKDINNNFTYYLDSNDNLEANTYLIVEFSSNVSSLNSSISEMAIFINYNSIYRFDFDATQIINDRFILFTFRERIADTFPTAIVIDFTTTNLGDNSYQLNNVYIAKSTSSLTPINGTSITDSITSGLGLMGDITTNFKNGFSALIWNSEENKLTTFGNFALIFLGVSITFAIVKLCLNLIRSKTGA